VHSNKEVANTWTWISSHTNRLNESLLNNFVSLEHTGTGELTNSIFNFAAGHRLMNEAIKQLAASYQPDLCAIHGPRLITEIVTRFCNFTQEFGPFSKKVF